MPTCGDEKGEHGGDAQERATMHQSEISLYVPAFTV
jgi:hypothetical protein